MTPPVETPANTLTLLIDTDQIECQVLGHSLKDADPGGGDTRRNGCGETVSFPTDDTAVGTLDVTLIPERGVDGFVAWSWGAAGDSVPFELVINSGEASAYQWAGKVLVAAIEETQENYGKLETVDVTWDITEWTTRAAAVTP